MSIVSSPSLSGAARLFNTSMSYYGGQRYSAQFADDTTSQNFFYDTWVYVVGNTSGFSNLEFDLNQTMSNGETVVMGFQCDTWNGTWDAAVNAGSPTAFNDTWATPALPATRTTGPPTPGITCRSGTRTIHPAG
jgi:hypothetical protein